MAKIICFGKVKPTTPGTPAAVTANAALFLHTLVFTQAHGQTGTVFVGKKGLNKISEASVLKEFIPAPVAGKGLPDTHTITGNHDSGNTIHPADYAVDADVAGEGVVVYGIQV